MAKKDKQFVARGNELCPICARVSDTVILVNKRLDDISKMDNKAIGFGDFCKDCKEKLETYAAALILVDEEKTDKSQGLAGLYRMGQQVWMKEAALQKLITHPLLLKKTLEKHFCVIDWRVAQSVGLYQNPPS